MWEDGTEMEDSGPGGDYYNLSIPHRMSEWVYQSSVLSPWEPPEGKQRTGPAGNFLQVPTGKQKQRLT